MNIGILTLPLHTNYGGILQAYALQTILERMGHEACLIEKKRKPARLSVWKAPLHYGKRILQNLRGDSFPIFLERKVNRETPVIRQHTNRFIEQYVHRKIVDDYSAVQEKDFDAIIVGSDQIWRAKYLPQIAHSYLDFTRGWSIKRLAYAASFGTDKWEYTPKQTRECGKLLQAFDAVSVREQSGVDLCLTHFGVKAEHVLDPTMLLTREDYLRLAEKAPTSKAPGNLFCYILDQTPEKTALIEQTAREKGLKPFRVKAKTGYGKTTLEERIQPPIEQWLRSFQEADLIMTDSFHACVFSILFNKPFLTLGNADRGMSRFISLLSQFGLEKQLVTDLSDLPTEIPIPWEQINKQLDDMRQFSMAFLKNNLQP